MRFMIYEIKERENWDGIENCLVEIDNKKCFKVNLATGFVCCFCSFHSIIKNENADLKMSL